jgi:hypothetical protein
VTFAADASDPAAVAHLFAEADERLGEPDCRALQRERPRPRADRTWSCYKRLVRARLLS